ncbi:hypothetical protein Q8F55_004228 [Vanrija albida]|uniref:COP9 signalosome complex subunit 3 n=1 Tax=Vanrija albida TaxID=181172 RepID=A0ABR3Q7A6_9TREE
MVDPSRSAGPSHAGFPSASEYAQFAPTAQTAPVLRLPSSAAALHELIVTTKPVRAGDPLITPLEALAGSSLADKSSNRGGSFQNILTLNGINLATLTDAQLRQGTAGYVFVLGARLGSDKFEDTLPLALRLAAVADPEQLAVIPTRVAEFAWGILQAAEAAKEVPRALGPLQTLLDASSNGSYFNGVHAVFLEATLLTGNYDVGYQSIRRIYLSVHKDTPYLDVLTYHHHAGTVTATVGEFAQAAELFVFAAAMPTESVSAIQVACAKRAILCELLATGKNLHFPKYTSSAVNRMLDKSIPDYLKLAKAFDARDWKAVEEAAQAPVFRHDCNRGLVVQILGSIPKRRILRLRQTYSRLTLADLAAKVESAPALVAAAIERMVGSGEIQATISGTPPVVTFVDDDDYASAVNIAKLKRTHEIAAFLKSDLAQASRTLSLSPEYLKKQVQKIDGKDKGRDGKGGRRPEQFGMFTDDIGPAPTVRGVGSNLDDVGF